MVRSRITLGLTLIACGTMVLMAIAAAPPKAKGTPDADQPAPAEAPPVVDGRAEAVKPAKPVDDEDVGPWEVTERVELVFREKLAVSGENALTAKIVLKNKSEQALPGKLVLVVDGTSVANGEIADPSGKFTAETPYLQMVPAKRELEPGDESNPRNLVIKTVDKTTDLAMEGAELQWRAFTTVKPAGFDDEEPSDEKMIPGKGYTWGEMHRTMSVQSAATVDLVVKNDGGVLGTGTAENEDGKLVIRVYTSRGGMARKLPGEIDGIPVEVSVVGSFKAGPAFSRVVINDGKAMVPEKLVPEPDQGGAADQAYATGGVVPGTPQIGPPTRRFNRPVPIGISVTNQDTGCSSGTLSCRVMGRDGRQYMLSNNHVFADFNLATLGDPICQPGLADNGCRIVATDVIGTLTAFQPFVFFTTFANYRTAPINTIDAAIALADAGTVDVCTPAGSYGTPSKVPFENLTLGLAVQKQGRTTNFTKGKIVGLNVESVIGIGNNVFARFHHCISIQTPNRVPGFGAAGDSGSLIVTVADRRPVGLLFAGGGFDTLANPISPVFNRFGVGVDNGTGGRPITGSGRMGTAGGSGTPGVKLVIPFQSK